MVELIEGERNHPRTIVSGGAADRDGGRCLLPGKFELFESLAIALHAWMTA